MKNNTLNREPLVSIIIPVYNGANYMQQAIDSAISQTYKNIEILVVNDGSNDNGETEKIALSYGDKIRYIKKENGGSSSALNIGIKNMNGEYFSWLSHDDLYSPRKIEVEVKAIIAEDKNCMVICSSDLIDANGNIIPYRKIKYSAFENAESFFNHLTHGNGINGCTVLIPKEIIDRVGFFDENFVYLNDLDYWFRVALENTYVRHIDDNFVSCRIHSGQVSVKKIAFYDEERHRLVGKTLDNIDQIKIDKGVALYNIASFCAMENLGGEFKRTLKLMKMADCSYKTCKLRFLPIWLFGFAKRFLKFLRKKIFFKR